MRDLKVWFSSASLGILLVACSLNGPIRTVPIPSKFDDAELESFIEGVEPLPYDILEIKDVSLERSDEDSIREDIIRKEVSVSIPESYSAMGILAIAPDVVERILQEQSVNAIFIYFYPSNIEPGPLLDVGFVVWAPEGSWRLAGSVQTGAYSQHQYLFGDYESPSNSQ